MVFESVFSNAGICRPDAQYRVGDFTNVKYGQKACTAEANKETSKMAIDQEKVLEI